MAMIATTISSSMSVKPLNRRVFWFFMASTPFFNFWAKSDRDDESQVSSLPFTTIVND
jgi:hypothetical protein